ncbi:hypothetical protein NQ317_002629 [Molorchus minor]|uniref:Large ribosomal subunit protein uL11 C-terminal domain-containing protein n=1 Tax=Molorchus minor TaxID=1323400 RepID=A0ABQ9IQB4_9CUCU|nr:hypothetical protein NQ317_002629 [Molorchus minor]
MATFCQSASVSPSVKDPKRPFVHSMTKLCEFEKKNQCLKNPVNKTTSFGVAHGADSKTLFTKECTFQEHRGINIAAFCKDFMNELWDLKEGIPLPTRATVNPDRAAGIQRAAMEPGKEIAGKITLKHVYEIVKIKTRRSNIGKQKIYKNFAL